MRGRRIGVKPLARAVARLVADEIARGPLHMNTVFLNLRERHDCGKAPEDLLRRNSGA